MLGVPFYVMDFIEGEVITDRLPPLLEQDVPSRRRLMDDLVDVLAEIHGCDVSEPALAAFARPGNYLERQVRRFTELWPRQCHPRAARRRRGRRSGSRRSCLHPAAETVVHGDFRLGNMIVAADDPTRIVAALDWEMGAIGDPRADVGYLLATYVEPGGAPSLIGGSSATAADGFPSKAELVGRYVERTGREQGQLEWFVGFALWKAAVFCEAIYGRYLRGELGADDESAAIFRDGVPLMAESALRALDTGRLGTERARDHHLLNLVGALADGEDLGVTVEAADRVLLDVAVATVDLHRFLGAADGEPTCLQLGLRCGEGEVLAGVLLDRRLVDEQACGLDLRGHVRELRLDRLEAADRLAEGVAFLRVGERLVERTLGEPDAHGRDPDPADVEHLQELLQARPARAEQIRLGNPAVGEGERPRVGRMPAHLPVGRAVVVAGGPVRARSGSRSRPADRGPPVFAVMQTTPEMSVPAFVMNCLAPSITHSPPSRRAVVFVLPASLPASGSVSPKAPSFSPEQSCGSHSRR